MVITSRYTLDLPQVSLPTYIFDSPTAELPKTPAFLSPTQPEKHFLSTTDFRLYAQRLASGLQRAGLQPEDRVLLFSGNTLFFPSVILGVIMAGGIFTGANPTYVARELAYQLRDSGAKYMICAEGSLDTGLAAAKEVGLGADRIFLFDDGAATFEGRPVEKDTPAGRIRHWTTLLDDVDAGRAFHWEDLRTEAELDRVVCLNYSSGTTGMAKGVMITHKNYVANCCQQIYMSALAPNYAEDIKRKRYLCFLPMYHAMAQSFFCVNAIKQRVPVYLMPKFDFLEMLQNIQKYRITDLVLVPPVVVAMAKHPAVKKFDLGSVEAVSSGAAPLGREVCDEFQKLWPPGQVQVKQGWGMTEVTCAATLHDGSKHGPPASVGEVVPGCEAKIVVDEEGRIEAKKGGRGEIWVRGPNIMKGYWKKPQATKETMTADRWLKTGDICHVDDDGYIFIVDRKKELIKVKGLQVAPAELESLLLEHPDVADVAVIGVSRGEEELPRAYIVPQVKEKATPEVAESIQKWLAERVSKAKRLEGGVRFVDVIPKNPSGKIMRRQLRDEAALENKKAKL